MESFVVQLTGRFPAPDLDQISEVQLLTVLHASAPDQAALHGLLRLLHDLGMSLVGLRQLPHPAAPPSSREPGTPQDGIAPPFEFEVVLSGPIGRLAVSTLAAHIEVTHLATRLLLPDRQAMNAVLERARGAGAAVEFAGDVPR